MKTKTLLLCAALAASIVSPAYAQAQRGAAAQRPAQTPRAGAPIDITGNWVAQITEDWLWRMITPPKGDYTSVPLTPAGREAAGHVQAGDRRGDSRGGEGELIGRDEAGRAGRGHHAHGDITGALSGSHRGQRAILVDVE